MFYFCLGFAPRSASSDYSLTGFTTSLLRYPDSLRSVRPQIRFGSKADCELKAECLENSKPSLLNANNQVETEPKESG